MRLKADTATEYRFSLIIRLHEEGRSQESIANLTECSQSWVSKVIQRHRQHGAAGLKIKGKAPGNVPRLSKAQLETLRGLLVEGALWHGFETDNWSRERIARLIKDKFEVTYHVSHMSKLMRQIGFTLQKPHAKSYRKDEQSVAEWKLKKESVKGIILDLRNNGGGSLRDVVTMSGLFIEDGPIVQVKSRGRATEILRDNDSRVQWGGPLIVMVNGFSASASEILAAAMQDYDRAVIVGSSSTYGKGTVQRFFDLDNAASDESVKPLGEMKMTIQKFYRITGKTTQLDGVIPDIVLPDFYNLLENGERDNDYPLASTTIEAVPFKQGAYHIADANQLKTNSQARVKDDPTFQKVSDNAVRLRKRKDDSTYPLQAEKYRQWNKKQDQEAEQFDNIFKPIESFKLANLAADLPQIQSDTSRTARNESWLKERQKDVQLYETLRIMLDMLRIDGVAAGKN